MDCNLQGTGIVSRPPISPELYFKTIGKKKMSLSSWLCLTTSSETFFPSQNGWLPLNDLIR